MKEQVKKIKSSINQMEDKKLSWVLMVPFIVLTAQYFFLLLNGMFFILNGETVQFASKVLVGIMFLSALPIVLKRRFVTLFTVYLIALFVFYSHFIIFSENQPYMNGILFPFFFMCLPAFVYSLSLNDWNIFRHVLRKAGFLVFVFGTSSGLLVLMGLAQIGDYSMALSYYLLLPAVIYLDELLEKPAFKPAIVTLISFFIILTLGSRGPIICIIIFFVLKIIRPHLKMNLLRLFFYIMTICVSILAIINLQQIFIFIYDYLNALGIRSRTLQLFLSNMSHLSGRDSIYENVKEEIFNSPILGIGIGGDRRVNGGEGLYAHNFFLEIIANFGILLGGILLIILLCLIIKAVFAKEMDVYSMTIIWMSLGFVHLMVSSSYLTDINFWIFIGLLINHFFRIRSP